MAAALPAATVSFGSDLLNESNSVTGTNVIIQPHPAWASLAPYHWISYANTGAGPGAKSPPNSNPQKGPTASFYESLPKGAQFVRLTVFADDTAAVYLIDRSNPLGLLLAPPNWRMDGACAHGPIGCEPKEGLLLEFYVNRFGPALLRFDVFQRGGGPFGLLYGGEAELAHSSEAAPFLLIATGLAWILWRRRPGHTNRHSAEELSSNSPAQASAA
ncbi:MAG: hypothetical protein N2036_14495 [Bryobacteraceae bacterium]|nr:hypothetical protein [Bryobacteraceae bacterium]